MNAPDVHSHAIFISFNQDLSHLMVGRKNGFTIYSINAGDRGFEPEELYRDDSEEMYLVQTLFSTDLVALVSTANRSTLRIFLLRRKKEIFTQTFKQSVVAVQMNQRRLTVLLEDSISVLDVNGMSHLHTIQDCPSNKSGISAISSDSDHSYLAYPGSTLMGSVNVFDTVYLKSVSVIQAHNSPVAALVFNTTGNLIATASEKGTVIRVFSVVNGQKLHEFRRGVKRLASICSLHFYESLYLACASNTETVHVFKLDTDAAKSVNKTGGWMDYLSQAVKSSAAVFSTQAAEVLSQDRDFAHAHLPSSGWRRFSVIVKTEANPRLLVASEEGILYVYNVDTENGGQCELLKQYSILAKEEPVWIRKSSSDLSGMTAAPSNFMVPESQSQQNRLVPFEESSFYSVQEDTDCSTAAPQTYASVVKKH